MTINATDEALLAKLPSKIAPQMRKALEVLDAGGQPQPSMPVDAYPGFKVSRSSVDTDADDILSSIFEAVNFPEGIIGSPDKLDQTCRTIVQLLANRAVNPTVAMPRTPWARRRWLGLDPPTAAEREIQFELGGKKRVAPLYQAIALISADEDSDDKAERIGQLFDSLPLVDRLDACAGLAFDCYNTDDPPSIGINGITPEVGPWAARMAPLFAAFAAPEAAADRNGSSEVPEDLRWAIFLGLARARLPVDPRCDVLLPLGWGVYEKATDEAISIIPEPRRGAAIARSLNERLPHARLRLATALLGRFPSRALLEVYIDAINNNWMDLYQKPRRERFGQLINFLENMPELREIAIEHASKLPALPDLKIGRAFRVSSVEQLSPSMRTQFNILARGWENDQGMMVSGPENAPEYGPISGVVAYEILDGAGQLAYEAFLYNDEDGAVCRAGTTNSVSYCSQRTLRCNAGDELLEALALVLSSAEIPKEEAPSAQEGGDAGAWAAYRKVMEGYRKDEQAAPSGPAAPAAPLPDPVIFPGEKLSKLSEYVAVMKGVMKGDMAGALARAGIDMAGYARLAAMWGQKMATDPAIAARYGQMMAG